MVKYQKKTAQKESRYSDAQRKRISETLEWMSFENWRKVEGLITEAFDVGKRPSRRLELEVANHRLRKGVSATQLKEEKPGVGDNPSELLFRLLKRIAGTPQLMEEIEKIRTELDSIPQVKPNDCRQALAYFPESNREYLLTFVPPNQQLPKERMYRDRDLARDFFTTDATLEELAKDYGLTSHGVRTTVSTNVSFLCKQPLARKEINLYLDAVSQIPLMTPVEVGNKLAVIRGRDGGREKIASIVGAMSAIAWADRSAAKPHKWVAERFYAGELFPTAFTEAYQSRFQEEFRKPLNKDAVDNTVRGVVTKLSRNPDICDRLRFHAGEIPKPTLKVPPPPEVDPNRIEHGHEFTGVPQPPPHQVVVTEPGTIVTEPVEKEAEAAPPLTSSPPAPVVEQPPQPKETEAPPELVPLTPPQVAEQLPPPKESPDKVEPTLPKEPPAKVEAEPPREHLQSPIPEPPREPTQVVEPEPPPEPTAPPLPDVPALSVEQFDAVLVTYQGTRKRRDMLAAAELEPLKGPSAQRDNELGRRIDAGSRAEGDKIFPFMSFVRTEDDVAAFAGILGHLEEACNGWVDRLTSADNQLTMEDIPRIALYSVLATDDRVRDDMADLQPALGERHLEVGRGYQELIRGFGEYENLRSRYSNTEKFYRHRIKELYRSQ